MFDLLYTINEIKWVYLLFFIFIKKKLYFSPFKFTFDSHKYYKDLQTQLSHILENISK